MKKIATARGAKTFPGLQGAVAIMVGTDYPSSLSDKQWRLIQKVLPPENRRGRKRINRRWIIDAVLYVCRTGCQWRYLPKDFPHWNTVYGVFRQWKLDGVWLRIHEVLRDAIRKAAGKKVSPTAGIIDSQSIRTAEGGEARGFDGGKKITGRKRHILVDTLGMLLMVVVHGADVQDYEGGATVLGVHLTLWSKASKCDSLAKRCSTTFAVYSYPIRSVL
jgi:putative transposase